MASFLKPLASLKGGRVLDVATGTGSFIHFLLEHLQNYDEIIGIDSSERGAQAFTQAFADKPIHFRKMDATSLEFPNASFDTVCIAHSLHHMPDLAQVLSEMRRVLKPGGNFVIFEMYRDNLQETQLTHVYMHHWWASIDSASGILHNETYTRSMILEIAHCLELEDVSFEDYCDLSSDPKDPETLKFLEDAIDRYQARAEELPNQPAFVASGEALRQRLNEVGFHSATALVVVGRKP